MLRQAQPFADEMVKRRGARDAVVEASEVAIAHIVGEDEHDVGVGGHEEVVAQKERARMRIAYEPLRT